MPLTDTAIRNARARREARQALRRRRAVPDPHAGRGALVALRLPIRREAAHPFHGRLPRTWRSRTPEPSATRPASNWPPAPIPARSVRPGQGRRGRQFRGGRAGVVREARAAVGAGPRRQYHPAPGARRVPLARRPARGQGDGARAAGGHSPHRGARRNRDRAPCLAELRAGVPVRHRHRPGRARSRRRSARRAAAGKETHHAAITDPKAIGALLRAIDGYRGDLPTRCALDWHRLRSFGPVNCARAEWTEFDLETGPSGTSPQVA